MPDLTGSLKSLINKGRAAKRAASVISLPCSTLRSLVSPNSSESVEHQNSTSVSSSVYSPAGSARTSLHGSSEFVGSYEAAFRASWLNEIASSPYENSVAEQPTADPCEKTFKTSASLEARKSDESLTLQGRESVHRQYLPSHRTLDSRPRSFLYHSQGRQGKSSWAGPTFHETNTGESHHPHGEANSYGEEEKMVEEKMRQIRRIKDLDVDSTRRAHRMAYEAFEIGSETLVTLQEQSSRLLNAEESPSQAQIAEEDAAQGLRELKRANRLVRINNPFVTTGSAIEEEADHLEIKQAIRERRDVGRAAKWQGWKNNRVHTFASVPLHRGATAQDVLDRARFQFEEDSEDEDLEDIIENNLDELLEALKTLKEAALASDAELSWQQGIIGRKKGMVDTVNERTNKKTNDRGRLNSFR